MNDSAAAPAPIANIPAEEHVLCAMMTSAAAITAVRAILQPRDFYRDSHGRAYRAALDLDDIGVTVDPLTLADELQSRSHLTDAFTADHIKDIGSLMLPASNAAHHARIVARTARLRRTGNTAQRIQQRVQEGGDIDQLEQDLLELATAITETPAYERPHRVTPLDEFLNQTEEPAEAIIGDPDDTLIPVGGLLIIGGEGGASKTTLTLDAIAHLASGTPWMGHHVNRPVRILIIENEGPRPQFRLKLQAKSETWTGNQWHQNVTVWEEPWAQFSFANPADRHALKKAATQHQTDLVVADPLDSLGILGAGTPEEVRTFIEWLKECGLHNPTHPLAFWILHHYNKIAGGSIMQRLSGAWGGHPDAIIGIELGDDQTTKLTWGKLRHATPPKDKTIILQWDIQTRGFTPIDKPPPVHIDQLRADVLAYVHTNPGASQGNIETALNGPGKPRRALREATEWLTSPQGNNQLATGPGKSPRGKYLYPASTDNSPLAAPLFGEYGESTEQPEPPETENHSQTNSPPVTASHGEYGELDFQASTPTGEEALAVAPSLPKGEGPGGESTERPPEALAASNGESPPEEGEPEATAESEPEHQHDQDSDAQTTDQRPRRLAEQEHWIDTTGWLEPNPLAALIKQWPNLTTTDLQKLTTRAEQRQAAEL